MTLLMIAILIPVIFSAFIVGINFLPLVSEYPMPNEIGEAMFLLFSYVKAWSGVFTVLNTLFIVAGIGLGVEITFLLWRAIRWVISIIRGTKA